MKGGRGAGTGGLRGRTARAALCAGPASPGKRPRSRRRRRIGAGAALLASATLTTLGVAGANPGGNANLHLSKTVAAGTFEPTLSLALEADRTTAIPADTISYSAKVTNTGATATLTGELAAANTNATVATISSWWDNVDTTSNSGEECSTDHGQNTSQWTPFAGQGASEPGYTPDVPPPIATGMTLSLTPVSAAGVTYPSGQDEILGTKLEPGATATWRYVATIPLTVAQDEFLQNASQVAKLRNTLHVEGTPRNENAAQPDFVDTCFSPTLFGSAPGTAENVEVTITPPSGSAVTFNGSSAAVLKSLAPGQSASVSSSYKVPVPAGKGSTESDGAYLARLNELNGKALVAGASANASASDGKTVAAAQASASTTEQLPVLGIQKTGPASAIVGTSATYPLALSNSGLAGASALSLEDAIAGGETGALSGLPATLEPAASANAKASYQIPATHRGGPLADTASLTWRDANGDAYGPVSSSFTTEVLVPAAIVSQPQSQTVNEAKQATFTAKATGYPAPQAQWQLSTDGGLSWEADTSDQASSASEGEATSSTLAVASANRVQNGYEYRAIFTNGSGSATTSAATLAVDWIGPVQSQPQPATVNEGQGASFSATASANPQAAVQWQLSTDGGATWANDTADPASTASEGGRTTSTLTLAGAVRSQTGHEYRAVFSDAAGSITTSAATLTVDWLGPIEAQPQSETVKEGAPASFSASASASPGASVRWEVSSTGGLSFEPDSTDAASITSEGSKTTSTLTLAHVARAQSGYEYRAVFSSAAGQLTTNVGTLTVQWIGPVSAEPEGTTADEGAKASFTASAQGSPEAFVQWQVSSDGGSTWASDAADPAATASESGTTTSTLTIAAANRSQNGYAYRAVFTNAAGSLTTRAATLTVNWIGPVESQPQGQTVDEGQAATFSAVAASNPVASVQWQLSTDGGKSWANDTEDDATTGIAQGQTTSTLTVSQAGRAQSGYEYRAVFTNAAGGATTNAAGLTVDWIGPVTTQPESQTAVEGKPVSLTAAAAANPGASAQWQYSPDSGAEWLADSEDSATTTSTSGQTQSTLTITSSQHAHSGYEYRAIFSNAVGSVTTSAASVMVERATLCTDDYVGPSGGLWQTASNWSTGKVPTASDVACVGKETTVDVTEGTNAAGVLLDEGGLAITGGSLELSGPSELVSIPGLESSHAATLTLYGESSTLELAGTLSVSSSLVVSMPYNNGPTISGSGTLVAMAGSTGTISAPREGCSVLRLDGATLANEGTLSLRPGEAGRNAGVIEMENGAKLENSGTFTDESTGSACGGEAVIADAGGAAPSISNTGALNFDSAGRPEPRTVTVPFSNEGTVTGLGGTTALTAGGSGNRGSWGASAGAALELAGGTFSLSEGTLSGPGTIAAAGASVTATRMSGESAHLELSAGSLAIPEGSSTQITALTLYGESATLNLGGTLAASSSFTVATPYTNGPTVSGRGRLVAMAGSTGTISAPDGGCAVLRLDGATLANEGTLSLRPGEAGRHAGVIEMENGAKLENSGTFNDESTGSACSSSEGAFHAAGGAAPSIINAGTFNGNLAKPGGGIGGVSQVAVPFLNLGDVVAQDGKLDFTGGGVGERVATGCWFRHPVSYIEMGAGSFVIEEGCTFEAKVTGATVTRSPNGLTGTLEAHASGPTSISLAGAGEDSQPGSVLTGVTVEATPAGQSDWKPVCGPLTPSQTGAFGCEWSTAAGTIAGGSYELRAQLSDNSRCPKHKYTNVATVQVQKDTLALTPKRLAPDHVGAIQHLSATLLDASGAPVPGATVALSVQGVNATTLEATTASDGVATFSYSGAKEGADSIQATYRAPDGASSQSNAVSVWWSSAETVMPIASTPVQGTFFTRPQSPEVFDARPGDKPAFSQVFPTIDFNPPKGTVAPDPWLVREATRPFTDLTTDLQGKADGAIAAEGNGLKAGIGELSVFDAVFTASFKVAQAGDVTFKITSQDGYLLGIGGGATRVSGVAGSYELGESIVSGTTSFDGLPIVDEHDTTTAASASSRYVTVHFPSAGSYPYELDYFYDEPQFFEAEHSSLVMSVATAAPETHSPLTVYVGDVDGCFSGLEGEGTLGGSTGSEGCNYNDGAPTPWYGSPEVSNFIGNRASAWDASAVMLHNNTDSPVTLEGVSVDVASNHYDLWGQEIEVAPHSDTILTQTEAESFDPDDAPPAPTCTNDGVIPQVHVSLEGHTETYEDTGQVLNNGGVEPELCHLGTEAQPWSALGPGQVDVNRPVPPAITLELTPTRVSGLRVGQSQPLTITALDAKGQPIPNLPVNVRVFGSNARELSATTNSEGVAQTTYTGSKAGLDVVSASAESEAQHQYSNQLQLVWAVPQPPPPPPASSHSGEAPPSVEILKPTGGSLVTGPAPVTGNLAGEVTSWKLTLTPAGGKAITLASGSGAPASSTLGEIEPAKLGEGTYTLALSAETSGGGATETEQITIGQAPGIPPPAPVKTTSAEQSITVDEMLPANGAVIGVPTSLAAKTTVNGISSVICDWYLRADDGSGREYHVARGGCSVSGSGVAPTAGTRVTLNPSEYPAGTYTLRLEAASAETSAHDIVSHTITLGTGVASETGTTTTSTTSSASEPTSTSSTSSETTTTSTSASSTTATTTSTTSTSTSTSSAPAVPPAISALSPGEGTVVRAPTQIKAKIEAHEGESIQSWSLSYQGSHELSATTFASGKGAPPEVLGTFDPTKLPNDTYTLTVLATSSGGAVQSESTHLVVSGNLKLGRFLQTYNDLEVPVSGFDMRLERVYDSTDKSVGDFGVGWHLLLSGFTVSTNGPLGQGGWHQKNTECAFGRAVEESQHVESSGICAYAYESQPQHTVTVTWPDKHQEVFVFSGHGEPFNNFEVQPRFTAKPGTNTTSKLEAAEPGEIVYGFDGSLYEGALADYWNATRFILTTRSGQRLVLSTQSGLVSEEDQSHNKLTVTASGIQSSAGPKLSFTRDSQGRITEVTGPSGQHLHYAYDPAGDLTSYTDADGNTTTYTYDSNHDLLSTTGPGASKPLQTLRYNQEGRLEEVIDAEGHATKISTNVGARTETIADPNGKLTTIETYDERGDPIEETKAADGKTLVTKHTYDSEGHLLSTTDPEGHTTTNKWDEAGDLVEQTDPSGNTTKLAYDPEGRLTSVVGPDGSTQETITYDKEGNPTEVERGDGSKEAYTYDQRGNLTSITRPSGVTERISYDSEGYPQAITDAEGHVTHLTYNASGQLLEEEAPTGARSSYAYDPNGNLTAITDGLGNTTTFTYDPEGHETSATDPLGKAETMVYDESGHLVKKTDRSGETTTYAYDADGNVTEEASANGESTKTTYDGFERAISLQSQTQTLGFAYDADGRVSQATASAVGAAPASTLTYAYDPDGNRTQMTGPDGTTAYTYDAYSRLTSLTPSTEPGGQSFQFSYSPIGRLTGLKRPDGIADTLTYHGDELTSRVSTLDGHTVASSTYAYNADGLRSSATDAEGHSMIYAYDPLGELTEEAPEGQAATKYEYDAAGNRKEQSGPQGSASYAYNDAEELTSNAAEALAWNPDGELEKRTVTATGASTSYAWNAHGELAAVHLPGGRTLSFAYDPLGRLVSVSNGEKTTSYVYDRNAVHLEYAGSSSTPVAIYTDGRHTNQLLEMERGGKRYSYLVDGQGSTLALADEAGNVVQRYAYDAFGNPTISGAIENPFLYTGQMWEPEAGLYYDRARFYEPASGRFISRDPIAHVNPYPYVANDPTNGVDPSGAFALSIAEVGDEMAIQSILTAIPAATFAGIATFAIEQELKDQVQEKIPPEWGEGQEAKRGGGWEWVDPETPKNRVRVDPGNERYPEAHVHVKVGGAPLTGSGEMAPESNARHPEAHIPLERYLEWESWDSPTAPESAAEAE